MDRLAMQEGRKAWLAFSLAVTIGIGGYIAIWQVSEGDFPGFIVADAYFYVAITESLVADGDFKIANQIGAISVDGYAPKISGQVSLGRDGDLVPKHSILMPLLAVPLYIAFGYWGYLVLNALSMAALLFAIALLGGATSGSRATALLAFFSTPLLHYSYDYSPDVFAAALVTWGLVAAVRERPFAAGTLLALALWAKPTTIPFVATSAIGLALCANPRILLRYALGAVPPLAVMALLHWQLYGAPWASGYERTLMVDQNGAATVLAHTSMFDGSFWAGLNGLLFSQQNGVLFTSPLWLAWPAGLWFILKQNRGDRRARLWAVLLAIGVAANLLIFTKYRMWNACVYGNRFLFPGIASAFALLAPATDAILVRYRRWIAASSSRSR